MDNHRVVVVGAGAWGLSAAIGLAEAGERDVVVVDRGGVGSGASGRAAGVLSSHLREVLDIRLSLETRNGIEALEAWARSKAFPEGQGVMTRTGGVTLAHRERKDALKAVVERVRAAGGPAEYLRGRRLRRTVHGLKGLKGLIGAWSSDEAVVDVPRFLALLRRRAQDLGVVVHSGRPIRLEARGGAIIGVLDPSGLLAAKRVILAAGSWSKRLAEPLGLRLPLKPYRTQLMRIRTPCDARLPILHDTTEGAYLRPAGPGAVLAGDGTEHVESDPERYAEAADPTFVERSRAFLEARLDGGPLGPIERAWAGLCAGTPDRWPLLGPVRRIAGLHLMVGDNGYGVMRSLALGRWVAHAVRTGALPPEAQPMAATRFDLEKPLDFAIREGFELWPRSGGPDLPTPGGATLP